MAFLPHYELGRKLTLECRTAPLRQFLPSRLRQAIAHGGRQSLAVPACRERRWKRRALCQNVKPRTSGGIERGSVEKKEQEAWEGAPLARSGSGLETKGPDARYQFCRAALWAG